MKKKLHTLCLQSRTTEKIYHPLFFRLSNDSDKKKLNQLLDEVTNMEVFDEILGQVEEFVKSQNPKIVFRKNELTEAAIKHIAKTPYEEYGVWVYYPWSKRLVHILDEKEFIEVRTNRNNYKITPKERTLLSTKIIGIIGLSVGQSIALTIAMERTCGELRIADFDILELSNLNRIRTGLPNLGVAKTIVVAREIAEIDPFFKVTCFHDGITEDNVDDFITKDGRLDILVDECDGLYVKILCRQKAKEHGIPVVMDTADRGMIDVERFDLEPSRSIFHGLIDHLDISKVKEAKTNEEKVPYLLPMIGIDTISTRLKASMVEIEQTITTWPQLASSVVLGGGLGADVCRRILLDQYHDSGRYFVDVEELIADKNKPEFQQKKLNLNPTISDDEMKFFINKYQATPVDGQIKLNVEIIKQLVTAATMATSGANSQSWKWMHQDKNLYLFLDGIYNAALLDTGNTTSLVGLGAATENLILKAHHLKLEVIIDTPPLDFQSKLIAVFKFFDKIPSSIADQLEPHICDELVDVIPHRLTNRVIGERHKIDKEKFEKLRSLAQTIPGADLKIIDNEKQLLELGEIVAKMDRIRIMHEGGQQDFRAEIRWTKEEVDLFKNGIDLLGTVDLSPSELVGFQIVKEWPVVKYLNDWEVGTGLEKIGRKSVAASSALGLITMPHFDSENFYVGGRALERIWLAANQQNISVHPASISTLVFNTLMHGRKDILQGNIRQEVIELRKQFAKIFSIENIIGEILLLRFFIAEPPKSRSVRYPLEQILKF